MNKSKKSNGTTIQTVTASAIAALLAPTMDTAMGRLAPAIKGKKAETAGLSSSMRGIVGGVVKCHKADVATTSLSLAKLEGEALAGRTFKTVDGWEVGLAAMLDPKGQKALNAGLLALKGAKNVGAATVALAAVQSAMAPALKAVSGAKKLAPEGVTLVVLKRVVARTTGLVVANV